MENIVTDGNIILIFHRIENQVVLDELHFSHIRANNESEYFIGANNNGIGEVNVTTNKIAIIWRVFSIVCHPNLIYFSFLLQSAH